MHYYKRNIGDYAKKAGRLSMLQHGSYTLLIDACYDREQFPTRDEAIDWTWASSAVEVDAVEFVLSRFFTLDNGVYVQSRIREEIAGYQAKATINQRIAIDRETKRKEKSTVRVPIVNEAPPNQEPLTTNHKPNTPKPPKGVNEGFEKLWAAYPRKVAKETALKAFEKRNPDAQMLAQMLAAIAVQAKSLEWTKDKGQYIPHPASWLNAGRWTDETTAEKATTVTTPQWVKNAGFSNVWEANNDRCFEHTAHEFRNGKRIEVAA